MRSLTLSVLATSLLAVCMAAGAAPLTRDQYRTQKSEVAAKTKSDKAACSAMSGNAKDICVEEAKGVEKVALAELESAYKPTAKHTMDIQTAHAKGDYAVAKEKCDDLAGNAKDVCRKEAKAAYTAAMAQAKLTEKTTTNNQAAAEKISEAKTTAADKNASAQKTASNDVRDADYKTAAEKCDTFAGDTKTKCIADAKVKFGQK